MMTEKELQEFIRESIKKAKSIQLDFEHKMTLEGKVYPNIASFALVTQAENDQKAKEDFFWKLERTVTKVVPMQSDGQPSYCFFNEDIESIAKFAGRSNQTNLFFCHTSEDGLVCEFWQKDRMDRRCDKALNPYIFISKTTKWEHNLDTPDIFTAVGDDFRFSVDTSAFNHVDEELEDGIRRVVEKFKDLNPEDVLPFAFNHVGQFHAVCKKILIG